MTALAGGSSASGRTDRQGLSLAPLPAGNGAEAFAFDPRRPSVVYMAIAHASAGVFVYKTIDDGQHWLPTGAQGIGWVSDILSLTADPTHPETLYAGTDTAVYKTVNGGRTWQPFKNGLFPQNGGQRICYRVGQAGKRYCVKPYFGTPGTPDFNRGNGYVLDVAVDPIHHNVLYSAAGAIRKSTDGGRTWKTVLAPKQWGWLGASRIAISPTRPESIYAITHPVAANGRPGNTTIYKSTNAGKTWQKTGRSSSLPPACCPDNEDSLIIDPGTPPTLYAAIGNTVLVTSDGGKTWQPKATGLPNFVTSLAADPQRPGTLYASVDIPHSTNTKAGDIERPTGGIYTTTDGGQTWSAVYTGFGIDKVAINTAHPTTIYAAGWAGRDSTHSNAFRLLRSTDGGHNWTVAR
jgi:photosystem II stability/assembly factor-like uncharacterized protein